jgi:uncharacterized iron-regulated membrane protein
VLKLYTARRAEFQTGVSFWMKEHFRQSMAWWHTWVGLVCGWLLFAIFFTGTTAVFLGVGRHWLQPELHLPAAEARMDVQGRVEAAERLLRTQEEDVSRWVIRLPKQDAAYFEVAWRRQDEQWSRMLNAATGEAMPTQPRASRAMLLLYRFHFRLHGMGNAGRWLVGLMAVMMLALLVTGVIVRKNIFTNFFTFSPGKTPARSWLDAHNASSVMMLPFALMISYSGLAIFWRQLMPAGEAVVGREAMQDETRPAPRRPDAPGEPAPTLPLWSFVERAQSGLTAGQTLRRILVFHPGGTQTQVRVSHGDDALLWGGSDDKEFNGASGKLLRHDTGGGPARTTREVLRALHEIRFAGPLLRWLYFLMGAGCCVMIVTGLVLWTVKCRDRALKQASRDESGRHPRWGWCAVEALNVGTVAGILSATAAMFWSNRLIPADFAAREAWEIQVFFLVWALCAGCALWRARRLIGETAHVSRQGAPGPRRLWAEQLMFAAGLYGLLPLVNAVTTPASALWVTIPSGQTAVAGFDLTMLGVGLLLALSARRVLRPRVRQAAVVARDAGKLAKDTETGRSVG